MNNAETLASLAILKVNADVAGQDYIEYLVPFVSFVLAEAQPDPVNDQVTQELLRAEFGLRIPLYATERVLRRLAKHKYLSREHGVYHVVKEMPRRDIESRRAVAKDEQQLVINALRSFASEAYDLTWAEDAAIFAIIGYLSNFSIECLKTYAQGCALPEVQQSKQELFVVNAFAAHVQEHFPRVFDSFMTLVKGNMLANALLCSDLESLPRKFSGVTFYLDTPLLLRLIGLEGEAKQAHARELVELLQSLKGLVAAFEHTAEEVHRVITWCAANLQSQAANNRNPVIAEARRTGKTTTDLELIAGRLPDLLNDYSIVRRNTPKYDRNFQIDELELEATIEDEIKYGNHRALEYDINSVRSIYMLRLGKEPMHLEDAIALLVTSNSPLAKVVCEYGKSHESTREISSVITDYSLANIAWLKAPLAAPDLPRLEIMAACYAAMEPNQGLWAKYVDEIDKLNEIGDISPRDHEILRYTIQARNELMNLTLGSETEFSKQTVTEILERANKELVDEENQKLQKERASHAETQAAKARLLDQQRRTRRVLFRFSQAVGTWASRLTFFAVLLIIVLFLVVTVVYAKALSWRTFWLAMPVTLLLVAGLTWSVVNWVFGISVKQLALAIETWVTTNMFKTLSKWLLASEIADDDDQ